MHCLGENTEKYISFSVKFQEDEKEDDEEKKLSTYKLRFIDSFRFMGFSLDSLTDNLSEMNNKTCVKCREKNKSTQYCEFIKLNENRLMYKCLKYEYIDDWNGFNETELPSKSKFHSNLNIKGVSDKDYNHAKNVWNIFNRKHLGDYHDIYVQSDTLLLSDIFEQFRKTCIKEYGLDPCYFVSKPGLPWEACLKTTNVNLELLTDIDMLLMFEKGIRGGISQVMLKYAKANYKLQ